MPSEKFVLLQASAIGRNAKTVEEFLEKQYSEEVAASDDQVVRLAIRGLMEVVQSSAKNIEIAVLRRGQSMEVNTSGQNAEFNC